MIPRPPAWRSRARRLAAVAGAAAVGLVALAALALWGSTDRLLGDEPADPLAVLKARFQRPQFLPHPADNPPTPEKIALGKRLFEDKRLSATGTVACASCHDPRLSFADGEVTGKGVTGKPLARHTLSLWNSAFSPLL